MPGEGLGGAGERGSSNGSAQSDVTDPSSAPTIEKETGKKEASSATERLLVVLLPSRRPRIKMTLLLSLLPQVGMK